MAKSKIKNAPLPAHNKVIVLSVKHTAGSVFHLATLIFFIALSFTQKAIRAI